MRNVLKSHRVECRLAVVLAVVVIVLSIVTDSFLTLGNITSLLNNNAVNLIWAVGLLVVLIAGGIDISFAVAASVVQYLAAQVFGVIGGNWAIGLVVAGCIGMLLGFLNAALIHGFQVVSIVITIATFNVFFGLLMFFTRGRNIYELPDWWVSRIFIFEHQSASGTWSELNLSVAVMLFCVAATVILIKYTTLGRQLYAFGDNPEGARRAGVNLWTMHLVAYGWCGMMAGIGGPLHGRRHWRQSCQRTKPPPMLPLLTHWATTRFGKSLVNGRVFLRFLTTDQFGTVKRQEIDLFQVQRREATVTGDV